MTQTIEMKAVVKGGIELAKVQVEVTAGEYLLGKHRTIALKELQKDNALAEHGSFEVVEVIPGNTLVEATISQLLMVERDMVVAKRYNPLDTSWMAYKKAQIGPYSVYYNVHASGFVTYGVQDSYWV